MNILATCFCNNCGFRTKDELNWKGIICSKCGKQK